MKVSSSKFTFSLIAFAALLVSGSGLMINDAYGFDAPEFTCVHLNTTATHCTFDLAVNGTLAIADWGIRYLTTATAGDITYDVAISNVANSSSSGVGLTAPSAGDIKVSSQGGNVAATVDGLGFLNGTDFVLIHAAIPSDATYYVNYTNNPSSTNNQTTAGGSGALHSAGATSDCSAASCAEGTGTNKMLKIGSNATAKDWMPPTAVSAEIVKSNPKQIQILMSEPVGNLNSTLTDFQITTAGGGNAAVEEAMFLTKFASKVKLIHRRDELRAEKMLQKKLMENKKIEIIWDSAVDEVIGDGEPKNVTGIKVKNLKTNDIVEMKVDGLFIAIGHDPATSLFKEQLDMDKEGYLLTKPDSTETNIPGVYAAGDVKDKTFRQAVTAAGMGCMAALEAEKFLSH